MVAITEKQTIPWLGVNGALNFLLGAIKLMTSASIYIYFFVMFRIELQKKVIIANSYFAAYVTGSI